MRAVDDREITNLRAVPVPRDRLELPEPVDLLFVSATYHHLPDATTYFAAARRHLRPGARVAILESRREGLLAWWLAFHASSPRQVQREMTDAGYRLVATHEVVRGYWFGEFELCASSRRSARSGRPEQRLIAFVDRDAVAVRIGHHEGPAERSVERLLEDRNALGHDHLVQRLRVTRAHHQPSWMLVDSGAGPG